MEIVTRRRSESEREVESYRRVEGELTGGDLFVVPAGHPHAEISCSDQPLEMLTFYINDEHNELYFLTGDFFIEIKRSASLVPTDIQNTVYHKR